MSIPRVQPLVQANPNNPDSRFATPSNWIEVQALQFALAPTVHDFYSFICKEPFDINPWSSYVDQWVDLQQQMEGEWTIKHRGPFPVLLWRKQWVGGIQNWQNARTSDPQNGFQGVQIEQIYRLDTPARAGTTVWEQERVRLLRELVELVAEENRQNDPPQGDAGASQTRTAATSEAPPTPVPQVAGDVDWETWLIADGGADAVEGS